jgi:hypothetical protein
VQHVELGGPHAAVKLSQGRRLKPLHGHLSIANQRIERGLQALTVRFESGGRGA